MNHSKFEIPEQVDIAYFLTMVCVGKNLFPKGAQTCQLDFTMILDFVDEIKPFIYTLDSKFVLMESYDCLWGVEDNKPIYSFDLEEPKNGFVACTSFYNDKDIVDSLENNIRKEIYNSSKPYNRYDNQSIIFDSYMYKSIDAKSRVRFDQRSVEKYCINPYDLFINAFKDAFDAIVHDLIVKKPHMPRGTKVGWMGYSFKR